MVVNSSDIQNSNNEQSSAREKIGNARNLIKTLDNPNYSSDHSGSQTFPPSDNSMIWTSTDNGEKFVGIDEEQVGPFETAVNNHIETNNQILEGLNTEEQNIMQGLKGDQLVDAVSNFFQSVKTLCQNYVKSISAESEEVVRASENWRANMEAMASDVNTDTGSIDDASANINIA